MVLYELRTYTLRAGAIAEAVNLGFHVEGFKAALLGALVVWLVNFALTQFLVAGW